MGHMKQSHALLLALTVVLAIGASARVGARPPEPVTSHTGDLLVNPTFELTGDQTEFAAQVDPYSGEEAGQLRLADGWTPWYYNVHECPANDPTCDPLSYNRRPEFKRESSSGRARSGDSAQKMFTSWGTHLAGFSQSVEVPPDSWVRFSAWVWVWSSHRDVPEHSFLPGDYGVSLGIDPLDGDAWDSASIQWSVPITRYDQWVPLSVTAHITSERISVWTRAAQRYPVEHNDSYWDDASLVVLDGPPEPTPTPTVTRTPAPTPDATPIGYAPKGCSLWETLWIDAFSTNGAAGWASDPIEGGGIDLSAGTLWLRNTQARAEAFPVAWLTRPWPEGELRLSFRFAFDAHSAYGTTIGVGSEPYTGERTLAGAPDPYGIEDILRIHHRAGPEPRFGVDLLGEAVWEGIPGDSGWHLVSLVLSERAYTVFVDGDEMGRATSHWRPASMYVGNPVIVWQKGTWTQVAIDDVRLETCTNAQWIPLVAQSDDVIAPTVTPSPTINPTPSATADAPRDPVGPPPALGPKGVWH